MLYKYRSIENFKYFVDVILNNRLYAAPYFDLNDPMEGHYIYSSELISSDVIRKIKGEKEKLRIVSLSKNCENTLMWTHYASGHCGVVIGIEEDDKIYDIRNVNYSDEVFNIEQDIIHRDPEVAKQILTNKLSAWSYEEEKRIFVEDGSKYANIEVKEIIMGSKMSTQNQCLIRELIKKINPNIKVKKSQRLVFLA